MQMPHLLSIDLGTSAVKVLVTTEAGDIVGQGSAAYPTRHPQPGWAEQDVNDWWQATVSATHQAVADISGRATIAAIGLSGQMHGTVLLDKNKQPLAPAIIWADQRSRTQVEEITSLVGAERLVKVAGTPVATGFQAATVRWVQQERPDLWGRVDTILLPKDYLRWRLTGSLATDPSDASGTTWLDVQQRRWSTTLLEALAIDESRLPPLQPASAMAGHLMPQAAEALGVTPETPVITGAADTACSLLGAGVVTADRLLLTISTGGQLALPLPAVQVDEQGRLHTFCSALPPTATTPGWYQLGATLAAGLSLRWLRDQVLALSGAETFARMSDWAETTPVGAEGLLFLPYLVGERTPHMDPQARGLFLGLTARHGQAELVRAVLEGVALACYDAFTLLAGLGASPERLILGGGGAKSRVWTQIIADVFNLPVQPLRVASQSALGAILLAGSGVGLFDLAPTAQAWAAYGSPVEPNARHHAFYQELLAIFRSAYPKHQEDFQRLRALQNRIEAEQ